MFKQYTRRKNTMILTNSLQH